MGNIGGNRNYGYGNQLAWAGKNALADRYGQGHFSTRATHEERWNQFAQYLKYQGINDARKVNADVLEQYGNHLKTLVNSDEISVAYAQNILSTVNVVLATMRKDSILNVSPAQCVGQRSNVRLHAPATYCRTTLTPPITRLNHSGYERVALVATLARELGLRFREASLLDAQKAIEQANRLRRINITRGTKGGRGKGADRWIPVNSKNMKALRRAARIQCNQTNLIPPDKTYSQWREQAYSQWRNATQGTAINGFHDMRAAYACERYQEITGYIAPVISGKRLADKALDSQARVIISGELGHDRPAVLAAYIGSSR